MAKDVASRIAANLAAVQDAIQRAASGRTIRLVCVTKYAREEWVQALLEAGATDLGENLLPAASERFTHWSKEHRFTRHLLGPQQSRKVKAIPAACDLFQALDRPKTVQLLQAELDSVGSRLDTLLEVNVDAEPQKAGYALDQAESAVLEITHTCPSVRLRGLMAVPRPQPPSESDSAFEQRTRHSFSTMAKLFARINMHVPSGAGWDTLSLGMSRDYVWAIAEGATMVRIGSALFAGLEG